MTDAASPSRVAVLARENARLHRENERLRRRLHQDDCRSCGGGGLIEGFFLGTVKKCPACNGSGVRGR